MAQRGPALAGRGATQRRRETPDSLPSMVQIETNIDDMNPEFYGPLLEHLLAAGALDVWMTPIQMKKERPGTLVSVLAPVEREADLARLLR